MKRGVVIAIRVLILQLIAVSVICCTDSQGGKKIQSYDLRFELATSPNTKSQEDSELPAVWAFESKTGATGTSVFNVFSGSQELSNKTYFNPDSKLIIPQSLLQSGSYHPTFIVEYHIQFEDGSV